MRIRKKALFCALASAMIISSGAYKINLPAMASSPVSQLEALTEAVSLYEQLSGEEISVPGELLTDGTDLRMLKSVMMGYINLDDTGEGLEERGIRKQDFISVLYKTIIRFQDGFAMSEDEANAILNECYDNVYIDDENRIAYAFMMKHGIITAKFGTEPSSEITKEGCEILTQSVYDSFARSVSIDVGGRIITVGSHTNDVLYEFGEPNRIDSTEYGFDWYVYNADYGHYCMIGIEADKVCAFFTNCGDFEIDGIRPGDVYVQTARYEDNRCFRFYPAPDGTVDAVLYNPRYRSIDIGASVKRSKSMILLDIINANRVKNGKPIYAEDAGMSAAAWLTSIDSIGAKDYKSDVIIQSGYDVFTVYEQLLVKDSSILTQETDFITPVGISSANDISGGISASILTDVNIEAQEQEIETVSVEETDYSVNDVEEVKAPVISSPKTENTYNEGDDVIIELEEQASSKYHIEMFDVENDEYAVNEYIVTDETQILLPHELFTPGRDYRLILSSITPDGESLSAEEILISYGSAYRTGIEIVAPYNEGILEDDYLEITWQSDSYHDFCVDLYNQDDELIVSKIVEDTNEAVIQGLDGGKYYLYVTALRRGTKVIKAQDCVTFTARQPEPIINEIILDKDDIYYFVYDDEDMGLLYFYDEELVDTTENGETVTKKKIIQKQVKATRGYRRLANNREKPEYTTGDPTVMYGYGYDSYIGDAIVSEAEKYLGVPYVWGGDTPDGFDCSGLVQYVLSGLGIDVNRVAEDQFENGISVNRDELQPGDLVFFERNGYIHHVGIYVGGGNMIHAPRTGDVVKYQSIETDYYKNEYAGARRVY